MVPLNTIRNVTGTVAARGYAVGFAQQQAEEAALTNQQRLLKIKLSWLSWGGNQLSVSWSRLSLTAKAGSTTAGLTLWPGWISHSACVDWDFSLSRSGQHFLPSKISLTCLRSYQVYQSSKSSFTSPQRACFPCHFLVLASKIAKAILRPTL